VACREEREVADYNNVRFSSNEIDLLGELKSIEETAATGRIVLALVPLLDLLASPRPTEIAVNILSSDWSELVAAAGAFDKIAACRCANEIQLFKVSNSNRSSHPNERLFTDILNVYLGRCHS
jgi:hypothetical protein